MDQLYSMTSARKAVRRVLVNCLGLTLFLPLSLSPSFSPSFSLSLSLSLSFSFSIFYFPSSQSLETRMGSTSSILLLQDLQVGQETRDDHFPSTKRCHLRFSPPSRCDPIRNRKSSLTWTNHSRTRRTRS